MRGRTASVVAVKVADAVWAATALLHREQPDRQDFSLKDIVDRIQREPLLGEHQRTTLYAHVTQHCVANVPPSSGRYRMLFETAQGRRRLFRVGDRADARRAGKMIPEVDGLPSQLQPLIDWYHSSHGQESLQDRIKNDPILKMRGLGKEIWSDIDADTYVRQLREERE